MPQWAGSCWYYLRFIDPTNDQMLCDPKKAAEWLPVDLYVGGAEHAVLHLLYARFWHKFLFDQGLVPSAEPFHKLRHQGMILAFAYQDPLGAYVPYDDLDFSSDPPRKKDGVALTSQIEKMSKSRGNVINPETVIAEHGADGLRLYEMFMGDFEAAKPWAVRGIEGVSRFLARAWRQVDEWDQSKAPAGDPNARLRHLTIKHIGERIELFKFNTAIAALMELVNGLLKSGATRADLEALTILLAPFAPHTAEAMWERLGHADLVATQPWPGFDPALTVAQTVTVAVQVNGKLRGTFEIAPEAAEAELQAAALTVPNVLTHVAGKTPRRVIVVKGKMVNIVV
jgi:leucyl-tRNA synthetase